MNVAIIVGGGSRVWRDLEVALQLCVDADVEPEFYVTNDMIPLFHDENLIVCTLHPAKLPWWLGRRAANLLAPPKELWTQCGHETPTLTTNKIKDWGGSSSLFAFQVARERGAVRAVLCGVPLDNSRHFVRRSQWLEYTIFRHAWENRALEIEPFVRSVSGGWTEEKFGRATMEWLK